MDLVVLVDEPEAAAPALLPRGVRDALPRLFVETALPLALVGPDGDLLAVNSGFCALVGRTAGTLAGGRIGDLLHPAERVAHISGWHALLGGLNRADRVEARFVRSDGRLVQVVLYRTVVSRLSGPASAVGLIAIHDESARTAAADRAARLHEIAGQLAAAIGDVGAVAGIATRAAADQIGDGAWIWTVDSKGDLSVAASWHRDPARRDMLAAAVANKPDDGGVLQSSVALNRPLRLAGTEFDSSAGDLSAMFASYAESFGLTGLIALPLSTNEEVRGVLGVVRDGAGTTIAKPYDDRDLSDVAALARTAGIALDNAIALEAARSRERLVRAVLDAIPVMAGVLDSEGRILNINAAWTRAAMRRGRPARNPVGDDYLAVWDSAAARGVSGAAEIASGVRDVIAGRRSEFSGDSAYLRPDEDIDATTAEEMWLHVHATVLGVTATDSDQEQLIVVAHNDITDRKQLEVRLAYEATHDPLTRLPNRTLLIDRIHQALARDRRAGLRTAVLFCDLDDFKLINDNHGHNTGDAVLVAVAKRFGGTVRASDTVSRIGGDEFVVLIEAVTDLDEALIVADKLVQSLREPADGLPPLPGVSVGVALSSEGATAESLLRASDATMYAVKQSGRGRVSVADETGSAQPASTGSASPLQD